jgi:hypothetical protein
VKALLYFCITLTNHSFCCSFSPWFIFKVFSGLISIVYVKDTWYFCYGDSGLMGKILVEAIESCVSSCITFSRICVFSEEEEEEDLKLFISSSFFLSLMARY